MSPAAAPAASSSSDSKSKPAASQTSLIAQISLAILVLGVVATSCAFIVAYSRSSSAEATRASWAAMRPLQPLSDLSGSALRASLGEARPRRDLVEGLGRAGRARAL